MFSRPLQSLCNLKIQAYLHLNVLDRNVNKATLRRTLNILPTNAYMWPLFCISSNMLFFMMKFPTDLKIYFTFFHSFNKNITFFHLNFSSFQHKLKCQPSRLSWKSDFLLGIITIFMSSSLKSSKTQSKFANFTRFQLQLSTLCSIMQIEQPSGYSGNTSRTIILYMVSFNLCIYYRPTRLLYAYYFFICLARLS